MDRAEEKKWQAQLQLQRDQMAPQQAARSFTLIKEALHTVPKEVV